MKKEFTIVTFVILFLAMGLSGCEELDKRFIGTWVAVQKEYPSFTFYQNQTYHIEGIKGEWEIKDGLLVLIHGNGTEKYEFKFSQKNYLLTLTGIKEGIERAYVKRT
jgi:hypothetical protein